MKLFGAKTKVEGWLAIDLQADGMRVAHVIRSPSAKPSVEWVAAYQSDGLDAKTTLEKFAKEMQPARHSCSLLLGANDYQMLVVESPNVPPDELKTAIRWRLKDMLDFHVEDATVDVLDIPLEKGAPVRNHSMYAVVARNQLIQQRQSLFEEAKIPLAAIDIPDMAQRNLSVLAEQPGRGQAMLAFDETGGLLTVTYAGELYLSRRIDIPLSQLQQSDGGQRGAVYERVILELQRSLDHFERQYHFIGIANLLLAPMGESGADLHEYLSANLYLPVESLQLERLLELSRVPELANAAAQSRYFTVLGAALRHEEKVL
jgi:MSHA biogenesis protein MshI